ncbi:PAS domain-containing protein [Desulfocicer niacini]
MQWSDELYRLHGVSPETFTPSLASVLGLIHLDDRQSIQDLFAASATGEQSGVLDFRINRPDGTIRNVRTLGEVVFDSENRPIYMAGTGRCRISQNVSVLMKKENSIPQNL